jgi:hypothetical protein
MLIALVIPALSTRAIADPSPTLRAYYSCLVNSIRRNDDHRPDTAAIAQAAQAMCANEWAAEKEDVVAGLSPMARRMAVDELDNEQLQHTIDVVLSVRNTPDKPPSN